MSAIKAIFLDRDGVINRERGDYTWRKEDFEFNSGIFDFLKIMLERGFLLFIISNQGGIAKGIFTQNTVEDLHAFMLHTLESHQIHITDLYYCPHHNDIELCLCRKPNSLLLEKAAARYGINCKQSYFIGDANRDVMAAEKAGIIPFKIQANDNLMKHLNTFV